LTTKYFLCGVISLALVCINDNSICIQPVSCSTVIYLYGSFGNGCPHAAGKIISAVTLQIVFHETWTERLVYLRMDMFYVHRKTGA